MPEMKTNQITQTLFVSILMAANVSTLAQTVDAPRVVDGDTWAYSVTEEKAAQGGGITATTRKWENTITRAGTKTFSVSAKQIESTSLPKELMRNFDWSAVKNINGTPVITSRPYDFPLKPGKEWQLDFSNEAPEAGTKVEKITKHYTVTGWTDIKVPAGVFHALKVEMEGEWSKEFNAIGPSTSSAAAQDQGNSVAIARIAQARTPKPVTGKLYQALWYVPETKTYVKSITEDYSANGTLHARVTEVLESMHVN